MKKVLIFSNGEQIGDGILKLPIVYQLKDRFPNYEIHWMTDTIYTEYNQRLKKFTSNYIDKIWEKAKLNPFFWKKISNVYNLNNEEFDIIIDTQKAVPRTIALKRLKTKIFISSAANWFFSNLKPKAFSKERKFYIKSIIEMLDLVSNYEDEKEFEIDIPQAITETLNKLFDPSKKYIGIAPGSNTPTRIWSFDKYLEVAKFYEKKDFNIVFFLGPEEQNLRKEIIDVIDNPLFPEEEVENYPGIEVVMASTNYLDIAITNDSGTGQMLSTNMCPLLKICGPTSAVKFLNDQFTNINFIASQSFGGDDIDLITSDAVNNEIDKILDS